MKEAKETQTLNAVFSGGETGTYTATVKRKILDIPSDMHALDVTTTLSECKTMLSLTNPTGLMLPGRQYRAFGYSACLVGDSFVGADTEVYMESDQLMAKLNFRSTAVYSSMIIKISLIFY